MKLSFFVTVFTLLFGRLSAQTQVLKGAFLRDTVTLTAKQGTICPTDTLLFEIGRYGGRIGIYFEGPQRKYFWVDPALRPVWLGHKFKPHKTLRIPVAFAPPVGFTGEAHAVLKVNGLSGVPWLEVVMIGVSTP
jgi:hypothetical protein